MSRDHHKKLYTFPTLRRVEIQLRCVGEMGERLKKIKGNQNCVLFGVSGTLPKLKNVKEYSRMSPDVMLYMWAKIRKFARVDFKIRSGSFKKSTQL